MPHKSGDTRRLFHVIRELPGFLEYDTFFVRLLMGKEIRIPGGRYHHLRPEKAFSPDPLSEKVSHDHAGRPVPVKLLHASPVQKAFAFLLGKGKHLFHHALPSRGFPPGPEGGAVLEIITAGLDQIPVFFNKVLCPLVKLVFVGWNLAPHLIGNLRKQLLHGGHFGTVVLVFGALILLQIRIQLFMRKELLHEFAPVFLLPAGKLLLILRGHIA